MGTKLGIRPGPSLGLSATPAMSGPQVSGGAVIRKNPVYQDSNGFIAATPTTSVSSNLVVQAAGSGMIAGFLQDPMVSSPANTNRVGFTPVIPGKIFEAELFDSGETADAHTLAQTDIGANFAFTAPSAFST